MTRTLIPTALAAVMLLAGCGGDATETPTRDTVATDTTTPDRPVRDTSVPAQPRLDEPVPPVDTVARPATRPDTLFLEGEPYPITSRRADAELYSVYYPQDMVLDQMSSGEGEGLRFTANFERTRTDSAFLHIFMPADPKAGPDDARQILLGPGGIVKSQGFTATETTSPWYPWALESYSLEGPKGGSLIGRAMVGEHRGRGFVMVVIYPEDYSEGMGPRIDRILRSLQWRDTRTGLFDTPPTARHLQ